jgi:hypothetical protein
MKETNTEVIAKQPGVWSGISVDTLAVLAALLAAGLIRAGIIHKVPW